MASIVRAVVARRVVMGLNSSRSMSDEGAIRDAGGKLAEKERAEENMYFRQLQAKQLKELKEHHHDEIENHEDEIKRLQKKIKSHKKKIEEISHKK